MSIKDMQKKVVSIYKNANENNAHNHDFIFSYLVQTIASGFKLMKYNSDPSSKFAKAMAYIFIFSDMCEMDLQDSFLRRFPKVCPYCFTSPCKCFQTNKKSTLDIPQRKYQDELKWKNQVFLNEISSKGIEINFNFLSELIRSMYPLNTLYWNAYRGPEYHISKCLEELGEVQEAYAKYLAEGEAFALYVHDEICDLFAWLLSAWSFACPSLDISNYFSKMYKNGCPNCNQETCACKSRNNRSDMLWNKADIEYIYLLVQKLDDKNSDILELKNSFKNALLSNSNTEYKLCIKKTVDILSDLQAESANKNVDDLSSVINKYRTRI